MIRFTFVPYDWQGFEVGTFPKCGDGLNYFLILGLTFLNVPHLRTLTYMFQKLVGGF
jgi:hypothetical protein